MSFAHKPHEARRPPIDLVGGKGDGLFWLAANQDMGFRVPEFRVLDTSLFEQIERQQLLAGIAGALSGREYKVSRLPVSVKEEVDKIASQLGPDPIAVRSSSVREDGENSFAGIYHSEIVEAPTPQKLYEAVLNVYNSITSSKAFAYRAEHGIGDDRMAVILQRFIEPDYSGVMFTSNPTFPSDISIEICRGRNTVVQGSTNSSILDFDKRTGKATFISENYQVQDDAFGLDRLLDMGKRIEAGIGASDIEFVVKKGEIYLVQTRRITGMVEPVQVDIPKYSREQFVGKSSVARGSGSFTLPALVFQDWSDVAQSAHGFGYGSEEEGRVISDYFKRIMEFDSRFPDGYVLVTPHFHDTVIRFYEEYSPDGRETTIDALTPNKKAVITTRTPNISSHIMTLSRERGIPYVGLGGNNNVMERLNSGDVLSAYFTGRDAMVYLEERVQRGLKETFPNLQVTATETDWGHLEFSVKADLGSWDYVVDEISLFLKNHLQENWRFEDPYNGGVMTGFFVNENGAAFELSGGKYVGSKYQWYIVPPHPNIHPNPVSEEEAKRISEKYLEYIGLN